MIDRARRGRGLAPDEADAEQIVLQPRDHAPELERSLNNEASAHLRRGTGGHGGAAEAKPSEPAEGWVRAELLAEVAQLLTLGTFGKKDIKAIQSYNGSIKHFCSIATNYIDEVIGNIHKNKELLK